MDPNPVDPTPLDPKAPPISPIVGPAPSGPTPAVPGADPSAPVRPASTAGNSPETGGEGKGVTPASVLTQPTTHARVEDTDAQVMPASAAGMQAPAMPPMASGGGAAGGSSSGRAPVAPTPPGSTPAARPASAARPAATARPAPARARTADNRQQTDDQQPPTIAVVPPIPVSTHRAERDAIAATDAARRVQDDTLELARRIAAALNARDSAGRRDLKFSWLTAVTVDGKIVVANSYGLAYIPEGLQLPEQAVLASADSTIPPSERARWTTYPVQALLGWAQHHGTELRAVIGLKKQLVEAGSSVPVIELTPDDIPSSGKMVGLNRLEIVDPEAANRLATATDLQLIDLLPPAPAGQAPEDQSKKLWFQVGKTMASSKDGRGEAHLKAFYDFATHLQALTLASAHSAVGPTEQRDAIAEWMYWSHVTGILREVIAAPAEQTAAES